MEIYVMRHPETEANVSGIIYGHTPVPLSAHGKKQIPLMLKEIEHLGVDIIYASPLERVAHWITTLPHGDYDTDTKASGLPRLVIDKRLSEMHFGVFEGLTPEEAEAKHPDAYHQYFTDSTYMIPEGESYEGFKQRVRGFGEELLSSLDTKILLVTHSLVIKELIELFLDLPVGTGFAMKLQPGSCLRLMPILPESRYHHPKR